MARRRPRRWRANDQRSRRWRRCRGCGCVSRSTVTRSARWPTAIRPASSKPSERWPSYVAAASSSSGRPVPALLGGQPLVHLHRAHLLEQVDHRMAVGAQREGGAGVVQPARRADAVGEVALGGRAEADVGARLPEQPDVVVGEVGGVHGAWSAGRARPPRRAAGSGSCPCAARQASFSATCSDRCTCSGMPCAASTTTGSWSRGTARTEWIAAPTRGSSKAATRSAQRVRVAVGVAHLHPLGRLARTRRRGSRCRAAGSGSPPRRRRRAGPCPSRWGRRTASRRAGGAGSGTPRPR